MRRSPFAEREGETNTCNASVPWRLRRIPIWLRFRPTSFPIISKTAPDSDPLREAINFQANQCVLNYRVDENGHSSQLARPIEPNDPIPQVFARAE
jgi:hypothetical protein